jgi:hypothetical protein
MALEMTEESATGAIPSPISAPATLPIKAESKSNGRRRRTDGVL